MIRRMKTCLVSILLATLLPSAMASAQTMDFACPDPGTTFTFDSGIKIVARARDGMACNMDIVGGTPFKMHALMIANPSPDGADTSAFIAALRPERLWPLQVGKKIEARYSAGGQNWDYILTVARYEKRTGPGDASELGTAECDNGLDDDGRTTPAGVYLVRLHAAGMAWSGRVVRLR